MPQTVLTPCPTCGKRFDFPLTGCITGVADLLLANSDGNCPDCGARVVVEMPRLGEYARGLIAAAKSQSDIRSVSLADLELSVRCRAAILKLPAENIGEILDHGRERVISHLGVDTECCKYLLELFADCNVEW